MKYYEVHLPLSLNRKLVYSSATPIFEGARVLVPLSSKLYLGICGQETSYEQGIKYKSVLEVLDDCEVLPAELMDLAKWMASYYHCPVGRVIFSMLPSRMQPDLDAGIKWIGDSIPPEFGKLHELLSKHEVLNISQIKKLLPGYALYKRIEEAEALGLVSVARKLSHKDKPKVQNYIIRTDMDFNPDTLPLKQRETWELICAERHPFPMANISSLVSYSSIKALVTKQLIRIEARFSDPDPMLPDKCATPKQIVLSDEQKAAVADIMRGFGSFNVNLLYGITGSGKTEVYIELIRNYLAQNKSIIFLIPEIALTPQMVERFQGNFGDTLAIQHSQLSEKDRFLQWQMIKRGEKQIIIGARSAIFSPLADIGLIIVDEEHEGSYKQDSVPRYHGRDVAIVRAQQHGAQVILGSATPSLETWFNAESGKYRRQQLHSRPLESQLPEVKIIDLRDEEDHELISPSLMMAIDQRLQRKEQVILFQNRRGYSSFMQCLKCGKLVTCSQCDISLAYHRDKEEMQCHYCGLSIPSPRKCPDCGSYSFAYGAPGTQKLEQTLKVMFPDAKILRMDSDSARKRDTYKHMYNRMKKKEVDILLGTQMISKGLDFPEVTLVGVILADISLNVPDFRAAERTFQLLTQVAGRSGRGAKAGEVIIQTFNPEHYAVEAASRQDYLSFVSEELSHRRNLYYPPYYRLARVLFQGTDLENIKQDMRKIELIKQEIGREFRIPELLLIGPSPAPFSKISNNYRYHLIMKGINPATIRKAIALMEVKASLTAGVSMQFDVDPVSLM